MEWGFAPYPTAGIACPTPFGFPRDTRGDKPPLDSPHGQNLHNARKNAVDCASNMLT